MSFLGGITIGPIYRTLNLVSDTGGMWAASYMFSFLAEKIVAKLIENKINVFSPSYSCCCSRDRRVGGFSDRIYFEIDVNGNQALEDISALLDSLIKEAVCETAKALMPWDNNQSDWKCEEAKLASYLQQYIQVYWVLVERRDINNEEPPLKVLNRLLDGAELRPKYRIKEETPILLTKYLNNKSVKRSPMFAQAFAMDSDNISFPSLDEIANTKWDEKLLGGIHQKETDTSSQPTGKNKEKSPEALYSIIINKFPLNGEHKEPKFLNYYALVRSDGDNIGKLLCGQKDTKKIEEVSARLLQFAREASQMIWEYKGFPVYAGGDDLLFFAPLVGCDQNGDTVTLITLLKNLDEKFQTCIQLEGESNGPKPSLSFGVAVTYRKFPLYEALDISYQQLFHKAKQIEGKNTAAIKLLLHSGQPVEFNIPLSNNGVLTPLETLWNPLRGNGANMPHSLERKLRQHKILLEGILKDNNDSTRMDNWFKQEFEGDESLLRNVKEILLGLYRTHKSNTIDTAAAILAFARFMRESEE